MRDRATADYDALAEVLVALGYPARLQLLDRLRYPHTLGEIRLSPSRRDDGSAGRPAARQTIQHHLDTLVQVGLVRTKSVEKLGKTVPQYAVNPQKLYALMEDMRTLSTMYAGAGLDADVTGTADVGGQAKPVRGPRLVLVHGVYEGRAYPLDGRDGATSWLIGRKRGLAVSLDYDPFVSLENAVVRRRGDGTFSVADLEASKNGTHLNWTEVPRGTSQLLQPGDVIGVGRSLLCFAPG